MITAEATQLLALCRIARGTEWNFLAREAQRPGGLAGLLEGRSSETGPEASSWPSRLEHAKDLGQHVEAAAAIVEAAAEGGAQLVTVLDEGYPINLRTVFDLPPFLFYRGELHYDDARSVAVVGTREASDQGLATAVAIAQALVAERIVVMSGLARGIDTAAHTATLDAGGRTVAVMGTGIERVYPAENHELAHRILERGGALVSQFWPDSPPRRDTFPRRNAVMSGMSQGTVVVEATATSGAKMQARLARQHGKRVFLMDELVTRMPWARSYVDKGAIRVHDVRDIVRLLQSPQAIQARTDERRQLSMLLA